MHLCSKTLLQLMLFTILRSLFQALYVTDAAINHSQEYNDKDSDVNLSKHEIIYRNNNDDYQYEINESDIELKDSYANSASSLSSSTSTSTSASTSTSTSTIVNESNTVNGANFLITDFLADGEVERRISYNGVIAKGTRISIDDKSLSLWQLSYDDTFIQMIYSVDNDLLDCEHLKGRNFAEEFVQRFYDDIERAEYVHKFNVFAFSLPRLRHRVHRNVSTKVDMTMDSNDDIVGMKNISYQPLMTMNDIPDDLAVILNYKKLQTQCDNRHRQMMQIIRDSQSTDQTKQINASNHLNRRKRALSDWLIAPNTKWCGRGQTADKYSQLGGASKADKCCRRHDHCEFNIHAMTTKWRLFNYRPFTISHCSCDMRFRTCLKMADSSDATMVGKLFFNIVQTKCFVLKPERHCMVHRWWGGCEKEGVRKRAHLRNNKKF